MAARDDASPKFQTVRYEEKGPICYITLNRPEKLNAATDQLVEDVNDALFEFDADPDLYVAILSGAGRAFCSGADVQQPSSAPPRRCAGWAGPRAPVAGQQSRRGDQLETGNRRRARLCARARLLAIASCDLVVAAAGTQFQIREVQRGLGGAQHWVATWFWTGSRFANEVALTPHVRRRGGAAARHGQPRGATAGAGWPRRRRSPGTSLRIRRSRSAPTCASCAGSSTRCSASRSCTRRAEGSTSRRFPGVGDRLRREAHTRLQGTMTPMAYEYANYEKKGRIASSRSTARSA